MGETTIMTILDGREIVYVARNATRKIVAIDLQLGSCLPACCTSMGRAQVVDKPRDELSELPGRGPCLTMGATMMSNLDALVAEPEGARTQGYDINDEALVAGLRSVGAPIRDGGGIIEAAITVSFPVTRQSHQVLEKDLAPKVMNRAREISVAVGARL
jgi:IclR family pca regulon transcriptional regulator